MVDDLLYAWADWKRAGKRTIQIIAGYAQPSTWRGIKNRIPDIPKHSDNDLLMSRVSIAVMQLPEDLRTVLEEHYCHTPWYTHEQHAAKLRMSRSWYCRVLGDARARVESILMRQRVLLP